MRVDNTFRVMWLINHTSARKFEIQMLHQIGVHEVFTPKSYPNEISFRSASVSFDEDVTLSIPTDALTILNDQDWYGEPSQEAWNIANKYFDAAFFILYNPHAFKTLLNQFKGALLWRAYGLVKANTHSQLAELALSQQASRSIKTLGHRLWFAQAYEHLHEIESPELSKRKLNLPLGMMDTTPRSGWRGTDARIYFLCADIETNAYYRQVYADFKKSLGDLPHVVAGAQSIWPEEENILGHVSPEEHARNMREFRLMFYHSQEQHHIHYHPFEAIRAGMPLVFMGGGMLDRLGGGNLPGRCKDVSEARRKIKRILAGDLVLQSEILQTQAVLLNAMEFEAKVNVWSESIARVKSELTLTRCDTVERSRQVPATPKRIAVIVPVAYRGGSLRGAKLLAKALQLGAAQSNDAAEIVFLHLDDPDSYPMTEFQDLAPGIKRRSFQWRYLRADEAHRAMRFAGHMHWQPLYKEYLVVEDGIKQLADCDLWIVISDRLTAPLLPLRPVVHVVYDYQQRYLPFLPNGSDQYYLEAVRSARQIWVTTKFTQSDVLQYAGLDIKRVRRLPMLATQFDRECATVNKDKKPYFLWTTNAAPHKNHGNALEALKIYYSDLGGRMKCAITGVNTSNLLSEPPAHLKTTMAWVRNSSALVHQLIWYGELPDFKYQKLLQGASFLWHAGQIDNGTFSVVEAAYLGVPALSSDYPAMREMDVQFGLNLAWMDASDPHDMARALKDMEVSCNSRVNALPSVAGLAGQSIENLAIDYWKAARECL